VKGSLGTYAKALVAVLVPALIALQAALANPGGIHKADVVHIIIAALGALGVYGVKNKPYVQTDTSAVPPAV